VTVMAGVADEPSGVCQEQSVSIMIQLLPEDAAARNCAFFAIGHITYSDRCAPVCNLPLEANYGNLQFHADCNFTEAFVTHC
jgi:hypothetical protein